MDARLQQIPFPIFHGLKTASKTALTGERVLCFFLIYPAAVCMMLSQRGNRGLLFVSKTDHVYVSHCLNCGSTLGHCYSRNCFRFNKEF